MSKKLSVAEMRMLRWFVRHTRRDRVRNEDIRDRVGVAPIEEKASAEMVWTCPTKAS